MSPVIKRQVYKCAVCQHEWIPEGEEKPEQCPSRKCRSRKWEGDDPIPRLEARGTKKLLRETTGVVRKSAGDATPREVLQAGGFSPDRAMKRAEDGNSVAGRAGGEGDSQHRSPDEIPQPTTSHSPRCTCFLCADKRKNNG